MCVSWSLGVRMYAKNAELFHRPILCIMESSTPALAAAVPVPMRKLWPANCSCERPIACSIWRIREVNFDFVNGRPSLNLKKGPGEGPWVVM